MSYTPIEIATGLNPNTDFLLKLDTQQRMNNVFNDSKGPIEYKVPDFQTSYDPTKGLTQNDIFKKGEDPTLIGKALNSDDPNVSREAYDSLYKQGRSQALRAGVGQERNTPYYSWQDKYSSDEFGFNPNLDQAGNEAYYRLNQYDTKGVFGKIASNTGKFIGRVIPSAALKLGEGFGYVGAMAVAGIENLGDIFTGEDNHNFLKTVSENSFSRKLTEWEDELKNSKYLSVYKPPNWDKTGFWEKAGDGAFWSDEFADGVSFLLSAAVPGGVIGRLGKGVSLLADVAEGSSFLGKLGKGWNGAARFLGVETLGDVGSVVYNTTSESLMEASDGFKTYKQALIDKRNDGEIGFSNLTDKEIDRKAGDVAAKRFGANMAILSVSNLFENKFFFKPIANALDRSAITASTRAGAYGAMNEALQMTETKAAKGIFNKFMGKMDGTAINTMARVPFYGKRFISASIMEGFWEENAQLAAERWSAQSTYKDVNNNDVKADKNLFTQYKNQTLAALRGDDPENSTSIGLGAFIGIFGGGAIAKGFGGSDGNGNFAFWKGERKSQIEAAKASITSYNKAYNNMLNVNDIFETNEKGEQVFSPTKAKEKAQMLQDYGFKQIEVENLKDSVLRKKLQSDLFAQYIAAAVQADVHNELIGRLENLPKIPLEKLAALGFDPTKVFNNPQEFADRGKLLIKNYQDIQESRTSKEKGQSFQEYNEIEDQRKYFAYLAKARTLSSQDSVDTFNKEIHEAEAKIKDKSINSNEEYPIHLGQLNKYNKLVLEQNALEKAQKEFDFFDNELLTIRTKERIKEIEKEKKSIHDEFDKDDKLKDRLKERNIQDSNLKLLWDNKILPSLSAQTDILISKGTKSAQLFIDVENNDLLHEKLMGTDGQKYYKQYLEYLAKRNVIQNAADVVESPEVKAQDKEDLEVRKKELEALKNMPPDGTKTDASIDVEIAAINAELGKLTISTPAEILDNSEAILAFALDLSNNIERVTPEDTKFYEDNKKEIDTALENIVNAGRFFYEFNGHKYYTVGEAVAGPFQINNQDEYDKLEEAFRLEAVRQFDLLYPEVDNEEPTNEETNEIIQGEENTNNVLNTEFEFNSFAWYTPFKTVGSEAENVGEQETLNPEGYTHALTQVVLQPINMDLYQPVMIRDREEWLDRFPEEKKKDILDNNKLGVVLAFQHKDNGSFLTIGEHIPGKSPKNKSKAILFSIEDPKNEYTGFNVEKNRRANIRSKKMGESIKEAMSFYESQEEIISTLRNRVLNGEVIPLTASIGSTGIVPTTDKSDTVKNRFGEFNPVFTIATKENIGDFPGGIEGRLYITFPGKTGVDSKEKFFSAFAPSIFSIDTIEENKELAMTIKTSIGLILDGKISFPDKASALGVINQFLEKLIYTKKGESHFEIELDNGSYFINYVKYTEDGKKVKINSLSQIKLNVNNAIFLGQKNLTIINPDGTFKEIPAKEYKQFIENRLKTYRKVVKGQDGKLHLDPMNAYFDLTPSNEELLTPEIVQEEEVKPITAQSIEEQRAEELNAADKISGLDTLVAGENNNTSLAPNKTWREVINEKYDKLINEKKSETLLKEQPTESTQSKIEVPVSKETIITTNKITTIEEARAAAKVETPQEEETKYPIEKLLIDLENGLVSYSGGIKPTVIEKTTQTFMSKAAKLKTANSNIVFGERQGKTSKVYFFGNTKLGTFVIFDAKLNQVKNEEKFSSDNPGILEDIQNQCK